MPRFAFMLLSLALAGLTLGSALSVSWITFLSAGVAVIVAIGLAVSALRPKDPYDLGALRRTHDRAAWREAENADVDAEADVVCPNCGTVYGSMLPTCPICGRR